MKVYIRKEHILSRHFDNLEDDSAGIFYGEEGSGLAWLWDSIQHIVGFFVHNMATTSHSIPLYSTTENPTARRGRWLDFFVKPDTEDVIIFLNNQK